MNMDNNQLTFVLNDKDGDKFLDTFAKTYLNGERLEAKSLNCEPVSKFYLLFKLTISKLVINNDFLEFRKSHEGQRRVSGTTSIPWRLEK